MSASSHELALTEAVPLAHALVARVAGDHDVRVLFIKGPAAAEQGLRPHRGSVDVDVLVDPRQRGLLAAALDELGWVDENPYLSPTVLPQHSLTHRHESWPCELDLHDRFPGFFADPQAVFETLWLRRTTVRVAAQDIPAPDRAGHALVLALHSLRDPHDTSRQIDLHDLEQRLAGDLTADDLRDLAGLARDARRRRHGRAVPPRGRRPADRARLDLRRRPAGVATADRALRHHGRQLGRGAAPPPAPRLAALPLVRRVALRPRAPDGRP